MTQVLRPVSATGSGWIGAVSDLNDASDATAMTGPPNPSVDQLLACVVASGVDPGTRDAITLHLRLMSVGGLDAVVSLYNADDSLVGTKTIAGVSSAIVQTDWTLTPAEAAKITAFSGWYVTLGYGPTGVVATVSAELEPDGTETGYRMDVYAASDLATRVYYREVGTEAYSDGILTITIPAGAVAPGDYVAVLVAVSGETEQASDTGAPFTVS
jgi:hypothetical protein